jgi:hypothetical protein
MYGILRKGQKSSMKYFRILWNAEWTKKAEIPFFDLISGISVFL